MGNDKVTADVDAALSGIRPGRAARLVGDWGRRCSLLAAAGVSAPVQVPGWVWLLDADDADAVLRSLVHFAQAGDEVAALTVLGCLRPGIRALARTARVPVDDVVSELAAVVLTFPLSRRSSVAGQLLLDTRQRLRQTAAREDPQGDTRLRLEDIEAPGEFGAGRRAPELLSSLVYEMWRAGELDVDSARLVLSTRVWGEPVAAAADRLGIVPGAAFKRRSRAESRIALAFAGRAGAGE